MEAPTVSGLEGGHVTPLPTLEDRLLQVESVRVAFRGLVALDDVSIDVARGEIVGLVGANGAGKTTLFNAVSGLQATTTGRVIFDGHDISSISAHQRARLGIYRTFQRMNLVEQLTVLDNLMLGAELHRGFLQASGAAIRRRHLAQSDLLARIEEVASSLGLIRDLYTRAADLSTGRRRLVEVARTLAARPRLLLLDEPSAGLDEHEAARFSEIIQHWVAAERFSVIIVEHDVELVAGLVDRLYVLDQGRVLTVGSPQEVLLSDEVRQAFLGAAEPA